MRQFSGGTGFLCYLKAELSFHKPKWGNTKTQLSLIYMEIFLSIPRPPPQITYQITHKT